MLSVSGNKYWAKGIRCGLVQSFSTRGDCYLLYGYAFSHRYIYSPSGNYLFLSNRNPCSDSDDYLAPGAGLWVDRVED